MTRLLPLTLLFVPTLALADVAPGCGCSAGGSAPLATTAVLGALAFLAAARR